MQNLRCFMYVSTAYSNAHLKRYSTVHEQLYPVREQDGSEVDHAAIVNRLLAMPVEEAQQEVSTCLCVSTYMLIDQVRHALRRLVASGT